MVNELSIEKLRWECDQKMLRFKTTEEISPLKEIIGQERAVKALRFGLEIKEIGFNIYVAGRTGTGRETAVKDFLEEFAKNKPVPPDVCYVNNFNDPYEPKAIELLQGKGKIFKRDMANLIDEVRRVLPEVFKSEDYAAKRDATMKTIKEERKKLFEQLNKRAQDEGFILQSTPTGLLIIPVVDGKPQSEQDFMSLKPELKDKIQKKKEKLSIDLRSAVRHLRGLEGKVNEALKKLNHEVAHYVIDHLVDDIKEKYKKFTEVVTYLKEVQNDILDNITEFLKENEDSSSDFLAPWMSKIPLKKYEVNVIIDNSSLQGAPVIIEHNPTYRNLFGRIEKEAQLGVLTTDFTMIHAGSLHKANGGFLVLTVEELLKNLFSWEGLKTALMNERIIIEEAGERLGFITTKGLKPAPIPLNIKVVLLGNPLLYHIIYMMDMEFRELFKVKAEFDTAMDKTEENMQKYAAFICTFCRKENLKHHDVSAVSQIIQYGSRLAEDQEKLSTRFADVGDIIREANFYATQDDSDHITAFHVQKAIEEKIYRSNLIQEKIQEMIDRGFLLIDTEGDTVGQVNGLSVTSLGDFAFGRPSRVTSSIGMGREGIIDIEREAKLGGRIHTKGVMILSGYLAEKYAQERPLSLSARLVFEQSYGEVEGDSASSTELYAILSSLSNLPIKQSIAVTGSVNQKGEVQAIGGINEKIEGFFEVCKIKGLTGQQGVIIPGSNVQNLMLKEEVVNAVKAGKFHIYPVGTIDQGIEVLTGVKAGERQTDGTFTDGTVNYMVDERLKEIVEKLKEFPETPTKGKKEE